MKLYRLTTGSALVRSLFFSVLCGLCCLAAPAALRASEIQITSQILEYDESTHYMVATGSVTVTWKNRLLTANTVYFIVDRQYLSAEGDVTLKEENNVMRGDRITYDYKVGTGTILHARGMAPPWFFLAETAARTSETRYETGRIAMTTCELANPHYHIRANKAKITLNRRITIFNPVFYLRKVPIFYLPVFTSALGGGRKDSLEIQPGYNSEEGLIIRTIYGYPLTEHLYGKLYLDFFSKKGWGTGAELGYAEANRIRGTLYAYHIKENDTGRERWNLRSGYWQKLNPLWTLQANADFVSDSNFNNNYLLSDWQRVSQQLHSYAAATRQDSKGSLRILAERYDVLTSSTAAMEPTSIVLPGISYTRYPQRFRNGIYNSLSLNVQNQYLLARDGYAINADFDDNITREFKLSKKLTFKPKIGLRESWQDRVIIGNAADSPFTQYYYNYSMQVPTGTVLNNTFITRYYSSFGLRYRLLRWIDWDFTHDYQLRAEPNSLLIDYWANDYGEERNLFTFMNSMYINRLTVRNSVGYNFHVSRLDALADWRERFTPFINEVTWTHPYPLQVYVRTENIVYPLELRAFQSDARFGDTEKRYFQFGMFYQSYRPDDIDFVTGFGFWPSPKWKIDYTLRTSSLNRMSAFHVTDQELKIYRDLHCWETKLAFRRRQEVFEFFFQIELKTSAAKRKYTESESINREFYPWR